MSKNINLLKQCLNALNSIPNTTINVDEYKNSYALAAHIGNEIRELEQTKETTAYKAQHVSELYVLDPDSHALVEVSVFKDMTSGGMFGIDSSYLMTLSEEDTVIEPFNGRDVVLLDGPFGSDNKETSEFNLCKS